MGNTFYENAALFSPKIIEDILEGTGVVTEIDLKSLSGSNITSTSSISYATEGAGLKSTQQIPLDWSKFEKHTFFNSAESKVNTAFDTIINYFPFDGTNAEVEDFMDGLSGFEKFVYDNFPKQVGFLHFSQSHINVTDIAGSLFPTLSKDRSGDFVLDPGLKSISFEFWMHAAEKANDNQVILQKISQEENGITLALSQSTDPAVTNLLFVISSGSAVLSASAPLPKGGFHHIGAVFDRETDVLSKLRLYVSGALVDKSSTTYDMGKINFIGANLTIGSGSTHKLGDLNPLPFIPQEYLSGALDDLKIYHGYRTDREIKIGSSGSVFPTKELKLYYKFNEATGSYEGNSTVLDSSGNSLHGRVSNFNYTLRNPKNLTDPVVLEKTKLNPVLFPSNQFLINLNTRLLATASSYDSSNPNLITKLIPEHYLLEAAASEGFENVNAGTGDTYGFTDAVPGGGKIGSPQIIASLLFTWARFFDDIKLYIDQFGKLLKIDYLSEDTISSQMLPFFANYYGFELPNQFSMASPSQYFLGEDLTDNGGMSEKTLKEIQTEIWRRILNNMNEITRSKGTIHSIKTLMRASGINPNNLFRFREFGGSRTITTADNRSSRTSVSSMIALTGSSAKIVSPFLSGSRVAPGFPYVKGSGRAFILNDNFTAAGYSYDQKSTLRSHWRFRGLEVADVSKYPGTSTGSYWMRTGSYVGPQLSSPPTKSKLNIQGTPFNEHVFDTNPQPLNLKSCEFGTGSMYVEISKGVSYCPTASDSFSIGGWVYTHTGDSSLHKNQTLFSAYDATAGKRNVWISLDDSGGTRKVRADLFNGVGITTGSAGNAFTITTTSLTGSTWNHVMVTVAGASAGTGTKIYINGAQEPTTNTVTSFAALGSDTVDMALGMTSGSAGDPHYYLTGSLSEWAIWQTELDQNDVRAIYYSANDGNFDAKVVDRVPSYAITSASDGLFTSQSFTYEGHYRFNNNSWKLPQTQSLARLFTTGSSAAAKNGALVMNLVAFGTSSNPNEKPKLVLYARPNATANAPTMILPLTGVNIFDNSQWHVSFGRSVGNVSSSFVTSSYFLRVGRQSYGNLVEHHYTSSFFDEGYDRDSKNVLCNLSSKWNSSGSYLVIGSGAMASRDGSLFLNSSTRVTDEMARRETLDCYTGHFRFWSKALSLEEDIEHVKNFKSLGVNNPLVNYSFHTQESGSFERLRIDVSTAQPVTQSSNLGQIDLFDFSQNNLHFSGSGFTTSSKIILPEQFDFSILNPKFDERSAENKIRIAGFEQHVNIEEFKALKAPVTSLPLSMPITDDSRFSIEISSVQALNDDIMNILATLDFYDNALGDPELLFAESYPKLIAAREVYFNRLVDRVNYKNLFEFYKWFDDSLSIMIEKLIPRSTKFLGINFVVESHALERAKMRYLQSDIYLGENDRRGLDTDLMLQQVVGILRRY